MTDCLHCEPLLHGLLDGELDSAHALECEEHLAGCTACADIYAQFLALRASIQHASLHASAPPRLHQRVRDTLSRASDAKRDTGALVRRLSWPVAGLMAASLMTFALLPRGGDMGDEVVSSHVRSLMASHLTDVASSDHHKVKPWFAGHVDFSPPIYDLAEQGYPLIGGRVDYLDGHTVAAVVYRRGAHVINLFIWPARNGAAGPALPEVRQGYNVLHWSKLGMSCWAVSDLNTHEMQQFEALIRAQTPT